MDEQPALIKAALCTYISNQRQVTDVMAHATPLPGETVSSAPFGAERQLQDLAANVRLGRIAVAPGAASGFGDLATWLAHEKVEGKFRAGNRWDSCSPKSVDWLRSQLESQVSCVLVPNCLLLIAYSLLLTLLQHPNFIIQGVSLMRQVGHQFSGGDQLGLACRDPFLEKLKALPGFTKFLELFNPLDGTLVFSNVMEDLTFTLFRTLAGQSSGFHLDTVTISTVGDAHPFFQVLQDNGVRPFVTKGTQVTHGVDAVGIITGAAEDVNKPVKLVWSPVNPADAMEFAHDVERRRTGSVTARGFSLDKAPSTLRLARSF